VAKKTPKTSTHADETPVALTTLEGTGALINTDDLALLKDTANTVTRFLLGAKAWLIECGNLDKRADAALAAARTLTKPKTAAEDEIVQRQITRYSEEEKATEAHHGLITSPVNKLHKFLTSRRKVTLDKYATAKQLAQSHHNEYVQAERRRVDEENRQREEQARRDEQARRQKEADDLEAAAVRAESGSADLSAREEAFVEYYVAGVDATTAAKRAGYAKPFEQGARLIASAKVQKAIEGLVAAASMRQQAAAVVEAPLEVTFEAATANVVRAPGAVDRTTKSCEILDPAKFRNAVLAGLQGIPHDTLEPDQVRLNDYARKFGKLINDWPGVRLVEKTTTVG